MSSYTPSARLAALAAKVISGHPNLQHLDDENCRIAYQTADFAKKSGEKLVYADTERVKDKYKGLMPWDFVVTFYWPNCEILTDDRLEKLMYHELRHVGFNGDGTYSIIPHDVEDFRDVIDTWGLDWISGG